MIRLIFPTAVLTGIWLISKCIASSARRVLAIDTEMVGAGPKGSIAMLGRVTIVDRRGDVIYDEYVTPTRLVTDYRTRWSGIREGDLFGAKSFYQVREEVLSLLRGCILVGHDVQFDLKALELTHPAEDIRDTAFIYGYFRDSPSDISALWRCSKISEQALYRPNNRGVVPIFLNTSTAPIYLMATNFTTQKPSLKYLARTFLGRFIQLGEHSSVEDARAAMDLYLRVEHK